MKLRSQVDEIELAVRENATEMQSFLDVEYWIDVHIGETKLTVEEILGLEVGSVVRLDRPASENVLLRIGDTRIGEAEVIFTKSGTGARVVEIG